MENPGTPSNEGREPPESKGSSTPRRGLPRSRRLTRNSQFREAYAQGRKFFGRYMVLWLRSADDASLKLGVVASRKVGGAVRRNRAKRRLREAFRLNRYRFAGHVDVVLVARRSIVSADWNAIVEELLALAGKAGLINATDTDGKESS